MTKLEDQPGARQPGVPIWDGWVRLSHWVLAVAVTGAWLAAENDWMTIHFYCGYTVLGVVLFRLIWGFVGARTARFAHFLAGPARTLAYLRQLGDRQAMPTVGHNPLGALMVVFMLVYFFVQAGLGLFSSDDLFYAGPLAGQISGDATEWTSDLHHEMGEFVPWIVGLHLLAVFFYLFYKRQNLVTAMVTGRRPQPEDHVANTPVPAWRGFVLAVLVAGVVVGLVSWGRSQGGSW